MKKKIVLFLCFLCSLLILTQFTKEEKENTSLSIFSTIIQLHKTLITNTYSLCSSYIDNTKEVFQEANQLTIITIHYIDTSGNNIHQDTIYNKQLGNYYEANSIDIDGYVLVEVIGNEIGIIKESDIEITYIYEKL